MSPQEALVECIELARRIVAKNKRQREERTKGRTIQVALNRQQIERLETALEVLSGKKT